MSKPTMFRLSPASVFLPGVPVFRDVEETGEDGKPFTRRTRHTPPGRIVHFPAGARALDVYPLVGGRFRPIPSGEYHEPDARSYAPAKGLVHPFESLALRMAWRLANPTLTKRQREDKAKFLPGSNQHRRKVKNNGALRGHVARAVSEADLAEIRGAVSLALARRDAGIRDARRYASRTVDGKRAEYLIATRADDCSGCIARVYAGQVRPSIPDGKDRAGWRAAYSGARKVLRMNTKEKRENLGRSFEEMLETNVFARSLIHAREVQEHDRDLREDVDAATDAREILARKVRETVRNILAHFALDDSRKAKSAKRGALATLRAATLCALGRDGHGQSCERMHKGGVDRDTVRKKIARFNAYVATGAAIRARAAQADELAAMHGISA